jgi:hypothetical protein
LRSFAEESVWVGVGAVMNREKFGVVAVQSQAGAENVRLSQAPLQGFNLRYAFRVIVCFFF